MTEGIRHVARVLVINDQFEVYLLRGQDLTLPERAPFWFTPGGKIDAGETAAQAACRELSEEIGLIATPHDLGAIIGTELSDYQFHGQAYRQNGVFFAFSSNTAQLNCDGWSAAEAQTIDQGKWWSVSQLRATQETVYPSHLADMIESVLATRTG
jgi:8-oxo-dGTP pyrophosphatase MutT (NUDIX family)